MDGEIWRFVVLHHTGIDRPHFDLLVEIPGKSLLMAWRIVTPPETWGAGVVAERLPDHRSLYMTYEGEISGNRGSVARVAGGTALCVGTDAHHLRLRLTGVGIDCELDLPLVGGLFKRTERTRRKTDLVILLTPTIMGPGQVVANTASELRRLDTAQKAADRKR